MGVTGLPVFDKTVQTTNLWLKEINEEIGPDRQLAWHVLGGVLRTLRDRLPNDLAAHLGAELPLLVRGAYYDQYRPSALPQPLRSREEFLKCVTECLSDVRPVNPEAAVRAVFRTVLDHLPEGQVVKVKEALSADIRALWPDKPDGGGTRSYRP